MHQSHSFGLTEKPKAGDKIMWEIWMSQYYFAALVIADQLEIFQILHETGLTADALAERCKISPRGAEALLAVLAGLGFLSKQNGVFELTAYAERFCLVDGAFSWGGAMCTERNTELVCSLLEALRSDKPSTAVVVSLGSMRHDDLTALMAHMHSHSAYLASQTAEILDASGIDHLLDVGGGSGCFCISLANKHEKMGFTILEHPKVAGITRRYVQDAKMQKRIKIVSADLFSDQWPNADAVFFSQIFHDWPNDSCEFLAKMAFSILPSGGKILIHEMLLSEHADGPAVTAAFSLHMLKREEGKQRTPSEFEILLRGAGFRDPEFTRITEYSSLITAIKP